jgi:hypothetical protein
MKGNSICRICFWIAHASWSVILLIASRVV